MHWLITGMVNYNVIIFYRSLVHILLLRISTYYLIGFLNIEERS